MKTRIFRSLFACMFVLMSSLVLTACGTKDFEEEKIKVGNTAFVYDGSSHIFEIDYEDDDVTESITYSTTADGEYKTANELSFVSAGTYEVYYKISAENYNDYVSAEPVEFTIAKASVSVSTMEELNNALTNNVAGNHIIVLNNDFDFKTLNSNQALVIDNGKVVLDLNGKTITGVDNGSNSWHAINLKGAGTELTIIDSSEEKSGKIIGRCYGIQVSRGAKLTIDGGNFSCTQNGTFNQNVVVYGGELVINGGTFESKVDDCIFGAPFTWDNVGYQSKITINGGKFSNVGTKDSKYALLYFEGNDTLSLEVVINGGEFINNRLQYIVYCSGDNIDFTNNASIPSDKIFTE